MIKGVFFALGRPVCIVAAALLFGGSASAALNDALVSHWTLDEISAENNANDSAGANHMQVVGTPVVEAGQVGNAFRFNGASSYLLRSHDPDRSIGGGLPIYTAGSYTIAMWVKGPAQTAKYLFAEGSTASNNPLLILQTGQAAANNNKLDVIIRNDAGGAGGTPVNHLVSSAVVFDDQWHHIAWVDDFGAVRLYIDGVLDTANFNYTPAGAFTFNTTSIGTLVRAAVSTGAIFNGLIDDVMIWERALSEEEVYEILPDVAPTITAEPADVTKALGDWALLSVTHTGYGPFTYQWSRNGEEIPGANSRTHQATGLTTANTGDFYSVKVTNPGGSVTSRNATITVVDDPAPDVRTGLVNYWPLNVIEQAGDDLISKDLYSGNHMVLRNFFDVNDTVEGKFGQALGFDFATKYTYRTNGAPIYNSTNYTVSMWVKGAFESQNDRRVFSEGSSTDNDPLFTLGTDNTALSPSATVFVRSDTGGGTVIIGRKSTRPVFDDTWRHIVWTDANGQGKLYVDGVLDETDYNYTRPTLTLDITALGAVVRAAVGNHYFGAIDDVATWQRVLSWTEIQEIFTTGVPEPIAIIPPGIVTQPLSRESGVFKGDTVTFKVQTSGTQPLTYEWYRNDVKIDAAANPSAATDTLTLMNVAVADSGSTFYVKVINPAGTATSDTVTLNVADYTPVTSGVVLNLDAGLTTSPNVMAGFDEFTLGINGTNFAGVGVTISGIGAALADRNRVTGAMVANSATMTQAQIYNDFIFANSTTDGTGLRILIQRLAPNTKYGLTIWSFDPQSTGDRISDWSETSSDTPVPIQTAYTFNGSVQPVSDYERTLGALLTSSPEGTLRIDAVRAGGTSVAAFVNALRLVADPQIRVAKAELIAGPVLLLTIETQYPGQVVGIEERADATTGAWVASSPGNVIVRGPIMTAELPVSGSQMFYRAVLAP